MGDKVKKALKIAAVIFIVTRIPFLANKKFVTDAAFFTLEGGAALAAKAFAYTLALGVLSKGISATGGNFGSKISSRAPTEPRQIIYGQTRVGGTMTHISTTGTDNHLLHMVFVIAGHEVNSLEAVILNDETLTTSSSTISGSTVFTATNSKFTNTENPNDFGSGRLVRFTFQDGSQTAVDGFMDAQLAAITTTDKYTDMAYVYMQCVFDAEKFGGGMPNVSFVVKGKKVYDPRLNSGSGGTAWSDNPALIIRDYLTDTTYGLKAKSGEINDGNVAGGITAAANKCDETVTLADGSSTEKRYTANGFTNFSANGAGVMNGVLQSMAGSMSYVNGQFQVHAGAHPTPSLTITDDDLQRPLQVSTKSSTGDLYNTVKSVFVDGSNNYIAADAPIYQDSTFLTEDTPNGTNSDKPNYVKTMEKQLPFTVTHTMAQRLQRISLKKQRLATTIGAVLDLKFLRLQPHDTVMITNERLGYTSKIFEVMSAEMLIEDSEDVPTLAVGLVLQETASSVYDFATSDYQTPVASGSTLTVGDYALSPPTSLSVETDSTTVDVLTNTSVTVTWSNASSPYIIGTEVLFKRNSDSVYSTMFANQGSTKQQITGLEVGVQYNFKARHLSAGSFSDFTSQVNHTVVGTATAKSALTNSTVDYSSDGTGTMPASKGGTGITNFANSTHLNSNTTKSDVGLGNVDNESSSTIRGQTTSGNHTGTVGGAANSTIVAGSSRAAAVLDSSNRFTGSILHSGTVRTAEQIIDAHERATNAIDSSNRITGSIFDGTNTRTPANLNDAFVRATSGLDSSGNVQRAVPAAQINAALTTVLTARPSTTAQWVTQDGAVYSPTGTNFDITITADNGTTSETGVFRWSFVNVSNSNADYISGCTEQTDSTSSFSVSVTTDLSGNDQKFAQATVTHDSGETIVISALLSQIHVSGGGKN
tara:strand:- start:1982 stop:4777 length:2796 start_codon:yes stop_codon:yes gene_type:complete